MGADDGRSEVPMNLEPSTITPDENFREESPPRRGKALETVVQGASKLIFDVFQGGMGYLTFGAQVVSVCVCCLELENCNLTCLPSTGVGHQVKKSNQCLLQSMNRGSSGSIDRRAGCRDASLSGSGELMVRNAVRMLS